MKLALELALWTGQRQSDLLKLGWSSYKDGRLTFRQGKRKRKVYVVKPGDTPSGIAEKTGVSLEQLEKANPDLDPQLLAPGQRIRIPQ